MTTTTTDPDDQLETALLSAYMHARSNTARAAAELLVQPLHFVHGRNRTMWEHLAVLHAAGGSVDSVTLIDSLDRAGQLEGVGGVVHVTDVYVAAPVEGDVEDYARRVADRARHRQALTAAKHLVASLQADGVDVETMVRSGVADILTAGRSKTSVTVDNVAAAAALDDLWANGPDTGWRSGWRSLDFVYRPTRGQLTVVTGIPNAGKTTWLNAYLTRLAFRHDHRFLMFSPEQSAHRKSPVAKHARNLAVVHGGAAMNDEERRKTSAWVFDHFGWVNHRDVTHVDDLLAAARYAHHASPFDGLVVDPWNWLEASRPVWMSETEFIGYALNHIVDFAQDLDVHVWVVAHPRKVEQLANGCYKVAGPYDVAGSAHWFNKPWFILSLWRDHLAGIGDPDRDPTILEVHVQKVRDDDQGEIGRADLRMEPRARRYAPIVHTL